MFPLYWSYFSGIFSALLLVLLFWLFLGGSKILSVLLLLSRQLLLFRVSLLLLLLEWLPLFGLLFYFLFFKPSIMSFSTSVFISVGFISILCAWIIEEKVFLLVEYLYWYFFFFCAVSLPFFVSASQTWLFFKFLVRYVVISASILMKHSWYFLERFFWRLISLLNFSIANWRLTLSFYLFSFLINLGRTFLGIRGRSITNKLENVSWVLLALWYGQNAYFLVLTVFLQNVPMLSFSFFVCFCDFHCLKVLVFSFLKVSLMNCPVAFELLLRWWFCHRSEGWLYFAVLLHQIPISYRIYLPLFV